eukprot:TRINITY_DN6379_c0_g1_i3.p1 TRINITY_DN6379_c0_g1~~TRINITY_DN6379_c0_g1_i3.p1  ORF type:complete len:1045 (-),score=167.77 TRINITY_DN6379_c0_g1_i3:416-3550(-)
MIKNLAEDEREVKDSDCVVESWGLEPRPCDDKVYPPLTQSGDLVLTAMISNSDNNLFTEAKLKKLRKIEDYIVEHKEYKDYCMRGDKTGQDTSCAQPVSPLGLFYANLSWSSDGIGEIFDKVDKIDGAADGVLKAFQSTGLDKELARIQGSYGAMTASYRRDRAMNCTTDVSKCCDSKDSSFISPKIALCLLDNSANDLTISPTAKSVFRAMLPLVFAFQMPRGDKLQHVDKTLKLAANMKTVGLYAPYVDFYFDKSFSVDNPVSKYSRGTIRFGMPLPGYNNSDIKRKEQQDKFRKWFREQFNDYLKATQGDGDVEFLFFATPLIQDEFISILLADMTKVFVSLALVFLWIWLQTNSSIIAIAGITEIILSIPLAFFFYYTIFGFKYFDGLNAMTIFIVAAIGADDIFVFMDQYKASSYMPEVCVDLKTRMNWVYGRASWAMFITSATTCAAFVCTASSPLPAIQSFGIFSAFVIAADYVLVITWFPAIVVLYHNHWEGRPCFPCCCWGVGEKTPCVCACRAHELWPCGAPMTTSSEKVRLRGPEEEPKKRMLERLLSGPFANAIGSWRGALITVVVFAVLLVPSAILSSQIQPLSRSEEALPANHPFQKLWTVSGEEFPGSAQNRNTPAHLVWGIDLINNDGVDILRQGSTSKGKMMMDTTFKFDEAAQQHIWKVCEEVRAMSAPKMELFLSRDPDSPEGYGAVECPLDDWKNWLEGSGKTFPLPLAQVASEMKKFMNSTKLNEYRQLVKLKDVTTIGFDEKTGEVQVVMVELTSQLQSRASHSGDKLKKHYDLFQEWLEEINSATGRLPAPPTANKAFQTCEGDFNGPNWIWMHTQGLFQQSAISGACIGTVLAFIVILIATQQIIIALLSFVSIACILATVIAMMKIANYELGSTTSICITILAGFAVDYVVHLAHAYNHSLKVTRQEKFQEAIDVIGVSVLSGMVTSVLAAMVLLTCNLQFFAKFGFFMIFTVIWAWLWGNCFFMAMLRLVGPDTNTHWVLQLPYSILPKKWFGPKDHANYVENASEPNNEPNKELQKE